MRYRRSDVVERAVGVLDQYGLADLSMRRIAAELGLQPSALYHHFASKQHLLAAVADELLERGRRPSADDVPWDVAVVGAGHALRDAMLAYRDGAELIATVQAFGLGHVSPLVPLVRAVDRGGLPPELARAAATTILHFVFGHVSEEQAHLQASSVGAIGDDAPAGADAASFDLGLSLILDGVRHHQPVTGA
ncbi:MULTISPECIES: TetR/AcrR family transcriptional regulator [Aeromicrobium]|uniref:TetR/AcrR family transcriptional regulator n=1 Tax=Aeromicrobium TaxID=2040 RepID=UPI0006F26E30|nr:MULTISPECIES: TetR/AcrR family transcriptional regulator C-terminal domain-containing protein [Aeromicrobium]KQX73915.1 TetR family transcriptional regulator [Aeromicrobium sp. Root472D3]MCL8252290.1 TetR/AcrR family transcriptional regulator C-terminal domain-containing protein [Aeromicrobium fastidiosum]